MPVAYGEMSQMSHWLAHHRMIPWTTSFSNASLSNKPVNSTRIPLAAYVVASTNDRMLPPHLHGDVVVEQLREVWGLECTYQRAKLGDHGFGVISKWTRPCAAWLRGVLLAADNP